MLFWRISIYRDLIGRGAVTASGRWNIAGPRMVYMAESAAGALLEICAHTPAENVPESFTLLKIAGPDIRFEEVVLAGLPQDWVSVPKVTQQIGSDWLKSGRAALLRVPSALVPETANYLLNPLHPEAAGFQIERSYEYPFDLWLKG
jgi:RES domain-containing protein